MAKVSSKIKYHAKHPYLNDSVHPAPSIATQGTKESGTVSMEPRKLFEITGTFPGTQGFREQTQRTQETLRERRDL